MPRQSQPFYNEAVARGYLAPTSPPPIGGGPKGYSLMDKLVRRWAIPVVLITLVGGVVAYAVTRRITPIYEAQATVLVVAGPQQAGSNTGVALSNDQVTTTAASLMTEPPILQRVINELKLNTSTDQLARRVTAIPITNAQLVNVTVQDPDAALATRIANTLSSDFVDQVTQQNTQRINQAGAAYQAQITALTNTLSDEENKLANAPRSQDTTGLNAEITANSAQLTTVTAQYSAFKATQAQNLETVSIAAPASQPHAARITEAGSQSCPRAWSLGCSWRWESRLLPSTSTRASTPRRTSATDWEFPAWPSSPASTRGRGLAGTSVTKSERVSRTGACAPTSSSASSTLR